MPFTMTNFQPLTPEQQNPFNAALSQAFKTYGQAQQAKYTPQTIQADIFSKQFAPLAQIASNPVAMAMMGDQGKGVMEMISKLLQQQGAAAGGGGGGLISRLFGGGQQPQGGNAMMSGGGQPQMSGGQPSETSQAPANYDPSLPQGSGNIGGGLAASALAKGTERPHAGDVVYTDPKTGKTFTNPSQKTIAESTESIQALKRVTPQLKDIARDAKEFTEAGSGAALKASEYGNWLSRMIPGGVLTPERLSKAGIDPNKISRYMTFQNKITGVAKDLLTAYPNLANSDQSMNLLLNMVKPVEGETTEGYTDRVLHSAEMLNQRVTAMQQQMQPLEVTGGANQAPAANAGGNASPTAQAFVNRVPNMKNDEEFKEAFNTLNAQTKKEVLKLLNG